MKKKLLFVINTLSQAGAETALLGFLRRLDSQKYEIYLFVLTEQGELIKKLPGNVRLLNPTFSERSVLTRKGRRVLTKTVLKSFVRNGGLVYKLFYTARNFVDMLRKRRIQADKLFWRVISDGAERFDMSFDLAVAWIEGGAAYYVADHVKARKKIAFIHTDYESAGYTRAMDQGCFINYGNIFAVSAETKDHFLKVYPEYAAKLAVQHNMLDQEFIRRRAREPGGFADGYQGFRILSVGRLTWQKGYDIAIEAMEILKKRELDIRWYVLGEGDQKKTLKEKIQEMELEEDFLLLGQIDNPYPYYVQSDLYVHPARYEGKSIAIQEAQTLGCAVIASDSNGNREQIEDGKDGLLCELTSQAVAECIEMLYMNEEKRKQLGEEAKRKEILHEQEQLFQKLLV
ncbi:MAG: glycosyltransferase [Ruminococcus sp.]|jgi:glycosyltransferase involved in cell wall biosynthesis|nr:glycosyltransferase [Ruminococcus sp.]